MDKKFLLTMKHSIRPTSNGGIIVDVGPHKMIPDGSYRVREELSFSNPVDYLSFLAQNYTTQQRQKQAEDDEFNTTTFGELK